MSGIHTCSYSCEMPECIKAQRNELVARLEAQMDQASGNAEYLAYLEAAVDDAGFVIKHDGGTLGNSNFRLEPKTQPAAAQGAVASLNVTSSVKRATKQDAPKKLWGRKLTRSERQCWAQGFCAAPAASPSEINLEQFR